MPLASLEPVSLAYGLDHYGVDAPFRAMLRYRLGEEPDYSGLGRYAGSVVYEVAYRVDRWSWPFLVNWDVLGGNPDVALLDPLERRVLVDLVERYGVNRHPFEGRSWHHHYTGIYLVGDPGLSCVLTITIQTAYALYKYAEGWLREEYRPLAGIGGVKWGATWFTEAQGGSDLGANETRADPVGDGLWRLYGYKYFASGAGLADWALVTARPPGAGPGAKGLALYAVPRISRGGGLNYRVRRLKWKSGTVAVPTGEVELQGSEAYLLGEAGKGIYYTLEDLMVSRLANSVGAMGVARKAYLEAYGYASVRRAFGKRILEHPLLARDLLEAEADIEAGLAVVSKAISLFDRAWGDEPPYTMAYHYARLMTHIAKNYTAEIAARVTRTAMEVFGGIGFLHEFTVERWHREALITPIWEGTSNIQALDMLEAMVKKNAHTALLDDLEEQASNVEDHGLASEALELAKKTLEKLTAEPGLAEWRAKWALTRLGDAVAIIELLSAHRATGYEGFHLAAEVKASQALTSETPRPNPARLHEFTSLGGTLAEVEWEEKARLY